MMRESGPVTKQQPKKKKKTLATFSPYVSSLSATHTHTLHVWRRRRVPAVAAAPRATPPHWRRRRADAAPGRRRSRAAGVRFVAHPVCAGRPV